MGGGKGVGKRTDVGMQNGIKKFKMVKEKEWDIKKKKNCIQ